MDRVSINDLHATILHLLGIDHKRLTYRYNGRDFRLTDVAGNVVERSLPDDFGAGQVACCRLPPAGRMRGAVSHRPPAGAVRVPGSRRPCTR